MKMFVVTVTDVRRIIVWVGESAHPEEDRPDVVAENEAKRVVDGHGYDEDAVFEVDAKRECHVKPLEV